MVSPGIPHGGRPERILPDDGVETGADRGIASAPHAREREDRDCCQVSVVAESVMLP